MKRLITMNNPQSPISEAYRGIRTSIQFSNLDKNIKVINITSSKQGEGKTTVLTNLATTFAGLEKKVLILDGDLRNPSVHRMFEVSNIYGLTDVLLENKSFEECVHCTNIKNLHVLTCGPTPPNPSEMLASKKMMEFIKKLREQYDYVFIDTPPIGIVTDAGIVSTYSDGCIFVVGAKEVEIETVKIANKRLEDVGANILGCILNKFEISRNGSDYYSHYYKEGRKLDKSKKKKKRKKSAEAMA